SVQVLLRPTDIPIRETLEFLARVLPPSPARILEVGAGNGLMACALAGDYEVVALDETLARPNSPAAERVQWVEADFLHYESVDPYDVLIFTRSLHHMALERALDRVSDLIRPEGRLVAEEFAYDRVNLPTARWYYDLESILVASGVLSPRDDGGEEGNPLGRW